MVATVGGLLFGLGLGLTLGRRAGASAVAERAATEARLRTSVLPVLERRASELGLETQSSDDPVGRAVTLASAIATAGPHRELALSDTLEAHAGDASRTVQQRPVRARAGT